MIELPNKFKGDNITLKIYADKPVNFRELVCPDMNVSKDILFQLENVEKFYITFSNMESTINEAVSIRYNEIIIKVEVEYKDIIYVYPLVTYVNNIYSLIRGCMLGFQKELDMKMNYSNEFISVDIGNDFKLNLNIEDISFQISQIKESSYPFIIFPIDLFIGHSIPATLNIKDYTLKKYESADIANKFIGKYREISLFVCSAVKTSDEFSLQGLIKI